MSAVIESVEIGQEQLEGSFVTTGMMGAVTSALMDSGDSNDVVNAGDDGDNYIADGGSDDILIGGLGADVLAFEFFDNEQINSILDFSQAEGDEIHLIDEAGDELMINDSFFTSSGIGDGEISVEFDEDGNPSINGEELDDDDFTLL